MAAKQYTCHGCGNVYEVFSEEEVDFMENSPIPQTRPDRVKIKCRGDGSCLQRYTIDWDALEDVE